MPSIQNSLQLKTPSHFEKQNPTSHFNLYTFMACLTSALCLFTMNYDLVAINIPEKYIHRCTDPQSLVSKYGLKGCVDISDTYWGWIASIISVGGLIGSLLSIYFSSKFGRKITLLMNNFGFICGGLMFGLGNHKLLFLVGRLLIGISGGIAQSVVSLYIAEVSTHNTRGSMGTISPILQDLGSISSLFVGNFLSGYHVWRIIFIVVLVVPILQIMLFPFFPETPRYSILYKNKLSVGKHNLKKLRGAQDINREYNDIITNKSKNFDIENSLLKALKLLFSPFYRKRLMLVCLVMVGQGVSGISAINYFSQRIVSQFFSSYNASVLVFVMSIASCCTTFGVGFYMDTMGRKIFLLISQFGVSASCLLIAIGSIFEISIVSLVGVMMTKIMFAVGLAGVPFIIGSEFFPSFLVSGGSGIVWAAAWMSHFVVGSTFLSLSNKLGNYVFMVFFFANATIGLVVYYALPETKGKTLEEIDELFQK